MWCCLDEARTKRAQPVVVLCRELQESRRCSRIELCKLCSNMELSTTVRVVVEGRWESSVVSVCRGFKERREMRCRNAECGAGVMCVVSPGKKKGKNKLPVPAGSPGQQQGWRVPQQLAPLARGG